MKMNIKTEDLCQDLPEEFIELVEYLKVLKNCEDPDYEFIKRLLEKTVEEVPVRFDWEKEKRKALRKKRNVRALSDQNGQNMIFGSNAPNLMKLTLLK